MPAHGDFRHDRPDQCPKQPQSRIRRTGCAVFGLGARGPRDLVQGHRRQRPLSHLHLSAAPRRADRLVRILARRTSASCFEAWGIINDPGCCTPGSRTARRTRLDETYGFDWCPGDDDAAAFVGKRRLSRSRLRLRGRAVRRRRRRTAATDQRQTPATCAFGTSTGALGFRKFPNPRFDADAGGKLNGVAATWEGYAQAFLSSDAERAGDSRVNRLFDGSIEPPFLIGMSCGACHIAFDPLNPPADPAHPEWENIEGAVGNQYSRISEILGSGMSQHRLEFQLFAHARPGTVDTSAVPTDQVNNPGTMNAIINFAPPAVARADVPKWRKAVGLRRRRPTAGRAGASRGSDGKCWQRSDADRDGAAHPQGRRGFDRRARGDPARVLQHRLLRRAVLGQPPDRPAPGRSGAAQLRPDAVRHRPVPARLRRLPRDRGPARRHRRLLPDRAPGRSLARRAALAAPTRLEAAARRRSSAPARSRAAAQVFARTCARCHSSQADAVGKHGLPRHRPGRPDAAARLARQRGADLREPGRHLPGRALHSNHMAGRVWEEYGSATVQERPADPAGRR